METTLLPSNHTHELGRFPSSVHQISLHASREKEGSILTKGDKRNYSLKNAVKQQGARMTTRKFQVDDDPSA